jgi:hypothetical protein
MHIHLPIRLRAALGLTPAHEAQWSLSHHE